MLFWTLVTIGTNDYNVTYNSPINSTRMLLRSAMLKDLSTPIDINIAIYKLYQPFTNLSLVRKSSKYGNYVDVSDL